MRNRKEQLITKRIWESGYREAKFCGRSLRAIKSGYVFFL